ncbi:phage tail tube protein [Nesterenkonia sp. K-15-9-6]|uniref:phage tail tube protein n=1 Tax=Nesterenkonia sp. K-15-9-6 TaxID=3093918 RepID=UPI004044BE9D
MPQTTGPRVLAEQMMSLVVLTDYTGPLDVIPADVINDGLQASCRAVAADTRLSPTDSDTLTDNAVCEPANAQALGASNYEARMGIYRYPDETNPGEHSEQYDEVFQALKEKGTEVVVVKRDLGLRWDAPFEAGQEIEAYRVTTDWPQAPQDRTGYQKRVIPLPVSDARVNAVVGEPEGTGE